MSKGGQNYRFVCDQIGSVRVIVNPTGAIAQQLDYDEFGNVLADSNPGFQPIAFAGGLYNRDTGFNRFGKRDYAQSIGRWTAPDPLLFRGSDHDCEVSFMLPCAPGGRKLRPRSDTVGSWTAGERR